MRLLDAIPSDLPAHAHARGMTNRRLEAMVENLCSRLSILLTALLLTTISISVISGQSGKLLISESVTESCVFVLDPSGVYLSLKGETIPDDGYVCASDIGVGNRGLHCNTDKIDCCRGYNDTVAQGHWYHPNGSQVGSFTQIARANRYRNFFFRDRSIGVIRLNRRCDPPERDRFRCEVPNADGEMVPMYVNIGEYYHELWINIRG